jgi:hypothetical protein
MSVSYGGESITFADNSTITSGWTGFKNRIINGAMTFAQRATSNTTPAGASDYRTLDRWALDTRIATSTTGVYTQEQSSDAPAGFNKSIKITTTTASNVNISSGGSLCLAHFIEGNNIVDLAWGTVNAKDVTLSFWVKSSVVGTYGVGLNNSAYSRGYVGTYTINSANTWEYKTITIPGETTGTWLVDNSRGIGFKFSLSTGGDYTKTPGQWNTSESIGSTTTSSTTNDFYKTSGATWQITGVQFEKGSTASSFEYRPYGTELQLCQRYYWEKNASTGNTTQWNLHWYSSKARIAITTPVPMRAAITATFTGTTSGAFFSTNDDSNYRNFSYVGAYSEYSNGYPTLNISLNDSGGGAATTGGGIAYIQNDRKIAFSAEL